MTTVSTETRLAEEKSKVDGLTRQLKYVQQRLEVAEGLERDLKRLGHDAEEMTRKNDRILDEKQVREKMLKNPIPLMSHSMSRGLSPSQSSVVAPNMADGTGDARI